METAIARRAGAYEWDQWHNRLENRRGSISDWERRVAYDLICPSPGERAVDLGCGTGDWTRVLANWGLETTGYDYSRIALDFARQVDTGGRVTYRDWDIDAEGAPAALSPGSVDIVTCRLSIEFLNRERLLTDVQRWLKPGRGRFYALIRVAPEGWTEGPDKFRRGLTRRQIQHLGTYWSVREEFDEYETFQDGYGRLGLLLRAPV
ncbi:class I SAM-dependent methyltransferase [Streptomyces sp. NPDC059071]|uniref:class I SAM-dependent methyltransferase n=1 Tax=unclassified Streptomyces TaxID=2593676 RepID=UPI00364F5EBC